MAGTDPDNNGDCLANAPRRQRLRVTGVRGDDVLARRLQACGLWDRVEVAVVGAAPFGDPLLVELHGFRLALRRSEAERVEVAVLEPEA